MSKLFLPPRTLSVWSLGKKAVRPLKRTLKILLPDYLLMPLHHKFIVQSLKQQVPRKPSILLCGWPKSGNTWTRFVIFNYFNILINHADKTLTYEQLNALQSQVFERHRIVMNQFIPGFPAVMRSHSSYSPVFRYFDKVIFLYRNPLDALISLYQVEEQKRQTNVRNLSIDAYVLSRLPGWMQHYTSIVDRCDVIMRYEAMRADAFGEFNRLFHALGFDVQESILRKSVELSNFENIKRMGRATNQQYGNHHPYLFKGEFTRSGQVNQYQEVLKAETIEACQQMLYRENIEIDRSPGVLYSPQGVADTVQVGKPMAGENP